MSMTPTQGTTGARGRRSHHSRHPSHFWRHFVEMFAVMVLGMIASAAIFLTIVQTSWDEATRRYPTASLLVIAAGMSIPMAASMLRRGMGSRNSAEMAIVMVIPVVPFLGLVWLGITESARAVRTVSSRSSRCLD